MSEVVKVIDDEEDELKPKSNTLQDLLNDGSSLKKYIKIGIAILIILIILVVGLSYYSKYQTEKNTEATVPFDKLPIPKLSEKLKEFPDQLKTKSKEYRSVELFAQSMGVYAGTGDFTQVTPFVVEGTSLYKILQSKAQNFKNAAQNSQFSLVEEWTISRVALVEKPDNVQSDPNDVFVVATIDKKYKNATGDSTTLSDPHGVWLLRLKPSGLAEPAYKVYSILKATSDIPQPPEFCDVLDLVVKFPNKQDLYNIAVKEKYNNPENRKNLTLKFYEERSLLWKALSESTNDPDIEAQLSSAYNIYDNEYIGIKSYSDLKIISLLKSNKNTSMLKEIKYAGDDETLSELSKNLSDIDQYAKDNCETSLISG